MAEDMKKAKSAIHYDRQSDVLYLGLRKGLEEEFVEIAPGVNVELDENGKVIGVEVLNASRILRPVLKPASRQTVGISYR